MNSSQREVYLVITAAFLGYSMGKIFDNIILLASPNNPKPILGIFLFGIFILISSTIIYLLAFKKK
ncbi:hypothetical protein COS79_00985 [Candidatus Woesearchaeota archaeon CG06_land_8_20_14_3_00_33_13]|nr:MAG: hypothetical protein COS79_00985 [Candidatus Woesearchaeota archaeon CG06_land_8_20_14_3_00_33_13]